MVSKKTHPRRKDPYPKIIDHITNGLFPLITTDLSKILEDVNTILYMTSFGTVKVIK